jgi:hypothetical protein
LETQENVHGVNNQNKAKAILSKKNNAGGIRIPNFKLFYRDIAIKGAWQWHKKSYEDQ